MNQLIPNYFKVKKPETFEAQPKLSEFDYWLQFIGLVCSFAGLSLHELTAIAIEFALLKVKKSENRLVLSKMDHSLPFSGLLWLLDNSADPQVQRPRK